MIIGDNNAKTKKHDFSESCLTSIGSLTTRNERTYRQIYAATLHDMESGINDIAAELIEQGSQK